MSVWGEKSAVSSDAASSVLGCASRHSSTACLEMKRRWGAATADMLWWRSAWRATACDRDAARIAFLRPATVRARDHTTAGAFQQGRAVHCTLRRMPNLRAKNNLASQKVARCPSSLPGAASSVPRSGAATSPAVRHHHRRARRVLTSVMSSAGSASRLAAARLERSQIRADAVRKNRDKPVIIWQLLGRQCPIGILCIAAAE